MYGRGKAKTFAVLGLAGTWLAFFVPPGAAAKSVGEVVSKTNVVLGGRSGELAPLKVKSSIDFQMIVATGAASNCLMTIDPTSSADGGALYLWPDTEIEIEELVLDAARGSEPDLELRRGLIRVVVPERGFRNLRIRAGTLLLLVKGTYLEVGYDPLTGLTSVSVIEGLVTVVRFDPASRTPEGEVETEGEPIEVDAGFRMEVIDGSEIPPPEPDDLAAVLTQEDRSVFVDSGGFEDRPLLPPEFFCDLPRGVCD